MTQKISFDLRLKGMKKLHEEARKQMGMYWLARYSWGQPCDPRRAEDWAALVCYLETSRRHGFAVHELLDTPFEFPSGNTGTIRSLIDVYHDGWELLEDIGVVQNDMEDAA